MHGPQQQYCSESKSGLPYREALDNHGVNPTDGPTELSTHHFGLSRGCGSRQQQPETIRMSPLVVTNRMIGQKELEAKQHLHSAATSA
jgi:hypothetical protein